MRPRAVRFPGPEAAFSNSVKRMLEPTPETQIICVSNPELLKGFAVHIDTFMIFMPGFVEGASLPEATGNPSWRRASFR